MSRATPSNKRVPSPDVVVQARVRCRVAYLRQKVSARCWC